VFRVCLSILFFWITIFGFSQSTKNVIHQDLIWATYINTLQFNESHFLVTELHERRFTERYTEHQRIIRSHYHFKLNNNWEVAPGFAYFLQYPHNPKSSSNLIVPELRPFLQINAKQKLNELFSLNHQYIAEWRFFRNSNGLELTDGYNNNFRFRYRIGIDVSLFKSEKHPVKLKIQDEIHINAGKNILYNRFDQNRIYAGLNYELNKNLSIETGYLNWYQQTASGVDFYNRNIIRFSIFQKIDLPNKKQ